MVSYNLSYMWSIGPKDCALATVIDEYLIDLYETLADVINPSKITHLATFHVLPLPSASSNVLYLLFKSYSPGKLVSACLWEITHMLVYYWQILQSSPLSWVSCELPLAERVRFLCLWARN